MLCVCDVWTTSLSIGAVCACVSVRVLSSNLLQKRRFREMPRAELDTRGLRRTGLSVTFHVKDAVGCDIVHVVNTAAGEFVKLVK